jgi:hypothetical protein
MAKEKATVLKPWQKEIKKEEYEKELLTGSRGVGQNKNLGKYYRIDPANPAYAKYRAEKVAKKKARLDKRLARASAIAHKKGVREGVKAFKNSDAFKKILAAAEKRGVRSAKPKQSLADRAAKATAKAKEAQKKADALVAKLKK